MYKLAFGRWIYFHLRSKIFFWPTWGGRSPPMPLRGSATGDWCGNVCVWCVVRRPDAETAERGGSWAQRQSDPVSLASHTAGICQHERRQNRHLLGTADDLALASATSCQGRSYAEARGGNCLLVIWTVILPVTRSHKRTKDVITRLVFGSLNAFGGWAV